MSILLIEPAIVPDIYASGRLVPEDLGNGDFRLTFFVKQRSISGNDAEEHVIVARIIMPAELACFCSAHMRLVN